jgi:hypothetical protein
MLKKEKVEDMYDERDETHGKARCVYDRLRWYHHSFFLLFIEA